jgi:hypothetical protein
MDLLGLDSGPRRLSEPIGIDMAIWNDQNPLRFEVHA